MTYEKALARLRISERKYTVPKKSQELRTLAENKPEDASAQFDLAFRYQEGIGVKKDINEAFHLYTLAVDKGDARAQICLARCYGEGLGVKKNQAESKKLYALAAKNKDKYAETLFQLGKLYAENDNISQATKSYKTAADQGHTKAQTAIGNYYRYPRTENVKLAERYLKLAADKGDPNAQFSLAFLYIGKKNLRSGFPYLQKAAEQNLPIALYELGMLYRDLSFKGILLSTIGIKPDLDRYALLMQEAADRNYPRALLTMGRIYSLGGVMLKDGFYSIVEKDLKKAEEFLQRAADMGILEAQDELTCLFHMPLGFV
jgi:uncharacterized protein